MKDKKNWSSELNPEEVSVGLDKVSHKLNGKVDGMKSLFI